MTHYDGRMSMEIVSEGSLENISRPSSTSKHNSRSGKREHFLQGSLEPLPPEDSSDFSIPKGLLTFEDEVIIEDIDGGRGLSSDEESVDEDEEWSSEDEQDSTGAPSSLGGQELAVVEDPEGDGSSVVEESLESAPAAIEQGPEDDSESKQEEEEENIDPKVKKGLEKIRKLDDILADKIKKEKEVKEQRRLLEKMWREQASQLDSEREQAGHSKFELGPAHYLALGPPENCTQDTGRESPPITPVFPTQPLHEAEADTPRSDITQSTNQSSSTTSNTRASSRVSTDSKGSKASKTSSRQSKNETRKRKKKSKDGDKKNKDFIHRNIMLAADAANTIPMTEEEKKRLDEIMKDETDLFVEENPFSTVSLTSGEGFLPSLEDNKALAEIDEKLKSLVPYEEHDLVSALSHSLQSELDALPSIEEDASEEALTEHGSVSTVRSSKKSHPVIDIDSIGIGERVLREEKEMRDMKQRLQDIEKQLQLFHQLEDEDQGVISGDLLRQLLDSSTRTTTRATTISQAVSSRLAGDTPRTDLDTMSELSETPRSELDTGRETQFSDRTVTSSINTSVDTEAVPPLSLKDLQRHDDNRHEIALSSLDTKSVRSSSTTIANNSFDINRSSDNTLERTLESPDRTRTPSRKDVNNQGSPSPTGVSRGGSSLDEISYQDGRSSRDGTYSRNATSSRNDLSHRDGLSRNGTSSRDGTSSRNEVSSRDGTSFRDGTRPKPNTRYSSSKGSRSAKNSSDVDPQRTSDRPESAGS